MSRNDEIGNLDFQDIFLAFNCHIWYKIYSTSESESSVQASSSRAGPKIASFRFWGPAWPSSPWFQYIITVKDRKEVKLSVVVVVCYCLLLSVVVCCCLLLSVVVCCCLLPVVVVVVVVVVVCCCQLLSVVVCCLLLLLLLLLLSVVVSCCLLPLVVVVVVVVVVVCCCYLLSVKLSVSPRFLPISLPILSRMGLKRLPVGMFFIIIFPSFSKTTSCTLVAPLSWP